jgi:hypothetical protein
MGFPQYVVDRLKTTMADKEKNLGVCEHRHIDTVTGENTCDYFSAKKKGKKRPVCSSCEFFKPKQVREEEAPNKEDEQPKSEGESNA